MEAEFWLERWNRKEIGFHQSDINVSLQRYWLELGLSADSMVFVPLCGRSRDMLWLRKRGHRVLGIEFIETAVRDFFAENGMTPTVTDAESYKRWEADRFTILQGDFFDLTTADLAGVEGVYDRAAIIALPESMRASYVDKLREILPSPVDILLITLSYPQHEMTGPPFAVDEAEVRRLYAAPFQVQQLGTKDVLSRESRFRERGLTRLAEEVYRIRRPSR